MLTLAQKRAKHALDSVNKTKNMQYGHYVSYVSSLPATIMMNGLGQALLTLLAKKDTPHLLLYNHISNWLCSQIDELKGDPQTLIDRLMKNDQSVYFHAQDEAMSYLVWLKQFARAYLKDNADENRGDA